MPEEPKIPVSVVVMTKNEEPNIVQCLEALRDFAEVFVVDSNSTDATPRIAAELGAEVVNFTWNGRYPKKKQWSLDNLPFKHDWVLYVDADEIVTPELGEEIREVIQSGRQEAGFLVGYAYVFLGRVLHHGHRVYKLVLFDRTRSSFPEMDDLNVTNMWEVEGHYQPIVEGPVGRLTNLMVHRDHDSLYHYFDRHNKYTDWEAAVRRDPNYISEESQLWSRRLLKRLFGVMPAKGLLAFLHSYVLRQGFRDGRAGFHYAFARGVYHWQAGLKSDELRRTEGR